jgi:hypothetical protein
MATVDEKNIPFFVLYLMARYRSDWSIGQAREFYEDRCKSFRTDVMRTLRREAYRWADALPEEAVEDMLTHYNINPLVTPA